MNFSCEDFIMYCEIHRRQYPSAAPKKVLGTKLPTCCQALFDPIPIFTYSGTCFTTKSIFIV